MNDDLVQPARGFGTHPHSDMEIVTYVVQGALSHKDSMGTQATVSRGGVQFMSAGSGVRHSEHNRSNDSPLRFIQMWLVPRTRGATPAYGQYDGNEEKRKNQWEHIVSPSTSPSTKTDSPTTDTPVKINSDANMFVTELSPSKVASFSLSGNRQAYVLCIEGAVTIGGKHGEETLEQYDAAELLDGNGLSFTAGKDGTHILLFEMALSK